MAVRRERSERRGFAAIAERQSLTVISTLVLVLAKTVGRGTCLASHSDRLCELCVVLLCGDSCEGFVEGHRDVVVIRVDHGIWLRLVAIKFVRGLSVALGWTARAYRSASCIACAPTIVFCR
jgi:hypothetical protein